MIYTELTNKAMKLAYEAHKGQTDINGIPYVFHPFHIAEEMPDEITTCVALLHDVVEDTDVTTKDLERDFPKEIVEAVAMLTHNSNDTYTDYVTRIKSNEIAKTVKLADLKHNSDETRFAGNNNVSEDKKEYWRKKYSMARKILEG